MEKFVCILLCLAAFASSESTLKCYSCDSDKIDGCLKSSNPKELKCGEPVQSFKPVCSYKVTHDPAKNTYKVHSGCEQIASTSPVNKESLADCQQAPSGMKVTECQVCNTDLCNSSPMVGVSMVSFVCLPIMYLVSKFVLF